MNNWTFLTNNLSKVTIDFLNSYRKENKFCLIVYLFSCIEYWGYYNNLVITCITGDSRINYWSWQTVKMPTASLLSCPITSLFTDTIFPGQTMFLDYWLLNIYIHTTKWNSCYDMGNGCIIVVRSGSESLLFLCRVVCVIRVINSDNQSY